MAINIFWYIVNKINLIFFIRPNNIYRSDDILIF